MAKKKIWMVKVSVEAATIKCVCVSDSELIYIRNLSPFCLPFLDDEEDELGGEEGEDDDDDA